MNMSFIVCSTSIMTTLGPVGVQYSEKFGILAVFITRFWGFIIFVMVGSVIVRSYCTSFLDDHWVNQCTCAGVLSTCMTQHSRSEVQL